MKKLLLHPNTMKVVLSIAFIGYVGCNYAQSVRSSSEIPTWDLSFNNPLVESFDEGLLPIDWQIVKESDVPEYMINWSFQNPGKRVINSMGFDENFAIADSHFGDEIMSANTSLTTPSIICNDLYDPARDFIFMGFTYDFPTYGNCTANLQASINDSETWDTIMIFKGNLQTQEEIVSNPQRIWDYSFDITDFFRNNKRPDSNGTTMVAKTAISHWTTYVFGGIIY